MGRMTDRGNTRALLQHEGKRAARAIVTEISHSAARTLNGKTYPYVFQDATAVYPFESHSHTLPTMAAMSGDPDFGTLQELVFVLPADHDGDGRPDMDLDMNGTPELDGNGDGVRSESWDDLDGIWFPSQNTVDSTNGVVWDHDEISFVLTTGPDGINRLERRVNGDADSAKVLARDVERVEIDTDATSQWSIPVDSVRLRIFFRRMDKRGSLYRHEIELVVAFKNT